MHPVGNIVRDVIAAHRDDSRMPHGALDKNRQIGRAAANINHNDAALAFLFSEDGITCRQRIKDEAIHQDARIFRRLRQIIEAGG